MQTVHTKLKSFLFRAGYMVSQRNKCKTQAWLVSVIFRVYSLSVKIVHKI